MTRAAASRPGPSSALVAQRARRASLRRRQAARRTGRATPPNLQQIGAAAGCEFGETPPVAGVGERVRDQVVVGESFPAVRCRSTGAASRSRPVSAASVYEPVRLASRSARSCGCTAGPQCARKPAASNSASRARNPAATSSGAAATEASSRATASCARASGMRTPRCACGAARCLTRRRIRVLPGWPEPMVVLVHRGPPGRFDAFSAANPKPLMQRAASAKTEAKPPFPSASPAISGPDLR